MSQINNATEKYGLGDIDIDVLKDNTVIIASSGDDKQFNGLLKIKPGITPKIEILKEATGITSVCIYKASKPNAIYYVQDKDIHAITFNKKSTKEEVLLQSDKPIADIAVDIDRNVLIAYAGEHLLVERLGKDKSLIPIINKQSLAEEGKSVAEIKAIAADLFEDTFYLYAVKKSSDNYIGGSFLKFEANGTLMLTISDEDIRRSEEFDGRAGSEKLFVYPNGKGMVFDSGGLLLVSDGTDKDAPYGNTSAHHTGGIISITEFSASTRGHYGAYR